jgi:capsular exopolysaccharide synthesis family protein
MNEIEKVPQPVAHHELVHFESVHSGVHQGNIVDTVIKPLLRHWRAALATFLITTAAGLPAIWFFIEPLYESTAAIQVAPIQQNILFKNVESEAMISNYRTFMNTQVELMASFQVLDRAADDLKGENLKMVGPDAIIFLRDSLADKNLIIEPPDNTELIRVTMKSKTPDEAEKVVNALIRAYMAVEVSHLVKGGNEKLAVLEEELRRLSEKRQKQREIVRQMSEEYGTTALTGRQDMMLQQVTTLQTEITKVQIKKMDLETQIQMLEKTSEEVIPLEKVIAMRNEFLKADPQLKTLSDNVAQLEQGMIVATQTMTAENPELQSRRNLLDAMKKRLNERQNEIAVAFSDMLKSESARNRDYKLKEVKAELDRNIADEERLNSILSKHNTETIELGRKQLAIKDQQEQFALTEEMYDTVRRRIQELEMESKRPAQVSIAYNAASVLAKDRRKKLAAANVFGAAMLGILLAIMLDRMDRRVYNPEDVTRRIGVRLLGTTINSHKIDRTMLHDRIADDYQSIRANLGLFSDEKIPHKVVVTSANAGEGKTTFAINLATSMAKAGTKVLLIDGDMRKPEVGKLLKLNSGSNDVREVLLGHNGLEELVQSVPSTGLDVLLSNAANPSDCFEILTRAQTARNLDALCAKYENVIIDTAPVLAVPDTLLWAKMADAVVLASFAGQTEEPDLQKAIERLKQIEVKILGIVVNNVSIKSSYNYGYGYGYGYGRRYGRPKEKSDQVKRQSILLSIEEPDKNDPKTF